MAHPVLKVTGLTVLALAVATVSAAYAFGPARGGHGMWGHHGMRWIARADANKDGVITREEVHALRAKRFARFDADSDGVVSAAEVEQHVKERIALMTKRIVRRFDQDRDGAITKAEFNRFADERFGWIDLNDDGKVTEDELPALKHRREH